MAPNLAAIVLLSCTLFATVCHADVSSLRGYNRFERLTTRLQRQEVNPTPYPAAGFRPDREFEIASPRDKQQLFPNAQRPETNFDVAAANNAEDSRRPDQTYGAPARLRQFSPARQQLQPQQTYGAPQITYGAPDTEVPQASAPSERLTARLKSARLSENREDSEDEEEAASEIEVDAVADEKKAVAVQPVGNVAYYPAGAVGFVHPLAAYVQPYGFAKLQAQPLAYISAAQFATAPVAGAPVAAAQLAAPATASQKQVAAPQQAVAVQPQAAVVQPQFLASPFLQQFAYAAPAQLQAW